MRGDEARRLVAERRLSTTAVEQVVRSAFGRLPISLMERGRALLRRYFSGEPWGYDEAAALAGTVGPGSGWQSIALDDELTLEWGWRGSTFRIDVAYSPRTRTAAAKPGTGSGGTAETREVALADTFDGPVVPEVQPTPATIRFVTGPAAVGSSPWYGSDDDVGDPRIRRLFSELADDLAGVQLGSGFVALQLQDASRWHDLLLTTMLLVAELFAPPRPTPPPDRALERAQAELGGLDPTQRRDLAFVRDALTSPDAAQRQVAVGVLSRADPFTAEFGWRVAMGDNSRAVRRGAVIAMAEATRPELRRWLERGLGDSDPCIRYHAVIGLSRIEVGTSRAVMEPLLRDDDARVRLATEAALDRRAPA